MQPYDSPYLGPWLIVAHRGDAPVDVGATFRGRVLAVSDRIENVVEIRRPPKSVIVLDPDGDRNVGDRITIVVEPIQPGGARYVAQ